MENRKVSVFFVEDNEMYSMMLDHKLEKLGNFRLITFTDGQKFLESLYLKPDIIILDYYLDGTNGKKLLMKVKNDYPGTPAIILSQQEDIQVVLDVLKLGAYDYVIKNEEAVERLFNAINNILGNINTKEENIRLKLTINKHKLLIVILLVVIIGMAVLTFSTLSGH